MPNSESDFEIGPSGEGAGGDNPDDGQTDSTGQNSGGGNGSGTDDGSNDNGNDDQTGSGGGDPGRLAGAQDDADSNFGNQDAGQTVQTCGQQPPASPPGQNAATKTFIEIELVDEEGNPVAGEDYEVKLPDGSVVDGSLDANGVARVSGIDPGTCQITFPNLDTSAWKSE